MNLKVGKGNIVIIAVSFKFNPLLKIKLNILLIEYNSWKGVLYGKM